MSINENYWCIAIVNNRHEKKVAVAVTDLGYDVYVPIQRETHEWSRGRKRVVDVVIIPAKIFIRIDDSDRVKLLQAGIGVKYFMTDACQSEDTIRKSIAHIPDSQIQAFKMMLAGSSRRIDFSEFRFIKGERVKVESGPMMGLEGIVKYDANGKAKIHILLDALGNVSTEISPDILVKL
ncbi:MAG: UpxY family transcription antiterminator [Prevotellaceae bacterium]|nr:UpxY family transcription antiterminator [Candidatus Colivivens equi]MCQ2075491.1 hypothetical protein [Bacteroidaceae bacterium]